MGKMTRREEMSTRSQLMMINWDQVRMTLVVEIT